MLRGDEREQFDYLFSLQRLLNSQEYKISMLQDMTPGWFCSAKATCWFLIYQHNFVKLLEQSRLSKRFQPQQINFHLLQELLQISEGYFGNCLVGRVFRWHFFIWRACRVCTERCLSIKVLLLGERTSFVHESCILSWSV